MSQDHFETAIATAKDRAGQVTTALMLREAKKSAKPAKQSRHVADALRGEPGLPPELQQLLAKSDEAMIGDLTHQLRVYRALRSGQVHSFALGSFGQIGRLLIAARIARGWTQARLAAACGLKPQQIQRYEAREYANAKLDRIALIAAALEIGLKGDAVLAAPRSASRRTAEVSDRAAG